MTNQQELIKCIKSKESVKKIVDIYNKKQRKLHKIEIDHKKIGLCGGRPASEREANLGEYELFVCDKRLIVTVNRKKLLQYIKDLIRDGVDCQYITISYEIMSGKNCHGIKLEKLDNNTVKVYNKNEVEVVTYNKEK